MFDLTHFTLRDMTELGGALRRLGEGAKTLEEVAERVVRRLYEELVDPGTKQPSCVLVRFFKTHPFAALGPELQAFAAALLHDEAPAPAMRCLTLLASAGLEPAWNSRKLSVGHQSIPLPSEEMLTKVPMISRLLAQLGVETGRLLGSGDGLLVEPETGSFNVFYVPEARGSLYIPAQEEFVKPRGVQSVLGFGGMLPDGNIFAVVLFARVSIPRETAELFRTLALNVKMAALPFDGAVFAPAARGSA